MQPTKLKRYEAYIQDDETITTDSDIELGVYRVSVVSTPAIEAHGVMLSAQTPAKVLFASNERQILIAPVLIPDKVIPRQEADGEPFELVWRKDQIEKNFNLFHSRNGNRININHTNTILECVVVDSYLVGVTEPDQIFGFDDSVYPVGTWIMAIYVPDTQDWNELKTQGMDSFSIEANVYFEQIYFNQIAAQKHGANIDNKTNLVSKETPTFMDSIFKKFFGKTKIEAAQAKADAENQLLFARALEAFTDNNGSIPNNKDAHQTVALSDSGTDGAKHELNVVTQNHYLKQKLEKYEAGLFLRFAENMAAFEAYLEHKETIDELLEELCEEQALEDANKEATEYAANQIVVQPASILFDNTNTPKHMSKLTELANKAKAVAIALAKTSGVVIEGELMGKALTVQDDNKVMIADNNGAIVGILPEGVYVVRDMDSLVYTLVVDAEAMVVSYEPKVMEPTSEVVVAPTAPQTVTIEVTSDTTSVTPVAPIAPGMPPVIESPSVTSAVTALTEIVKTLMEEIAQIKKMVGTPVSKPLNQSAKFTNEKPAIALAKTERSRQS